MQRVEGRCKIPAIHSGDGEWRNSLERLYVVPVINVPPLFFELVIGRECSERGAYELRKR